MEAIIVNENMSLQYEPIDEHLRISTLRPNAKPSNWSFQAIRKHEKDNSHNCYGTTVKDSNAYFSIPISDKHCNNPNLKESCSIEVDMIHSWDSAYISNSTCTLYAVSRFGLKKEIHTFNTRHNECPVEDSSRIGFGSSATKKKKNSHKRQIQGTFPCTHTIPLTTASSKVTLKCTNLESSKLTCISKVALTYVT